MITEVTGDAIRSAEDGLVCREPLAKTSRAATNSRPIPHAAAETAVDVAGQPPTCASVLAEVHGNKHQPLAAERDAGERSHGSPVCEPGHVLSRLSWKRPVAHRYAFEAGAGNVLEVFSDRAAVDD